jgi:hypothetical protein
VALAQRDLSDFWSSLTFGDGVRVRDSLLRFYPLLVETYGDAAALLGADWYDLNRSVPPSAARFRAVLAGTAPRVQAEASARWAIGPLFQADPDPVQALSNLNGVTQRLVLQPGRSTVWDSAAADPVRTRVARVPSGSDTCRFCVMLASRGAVYTSAAAAGRGNEYHNDCDCVPTPIRDDRDYPEDYDLSALKTLYEKGSALGDAH